MGVIISQFIIWNYITRYDLIFQMWWNYINIPCGISRLIFTQKASFLYDRNKSRQAGIMFQCTIKTEILHLFHTVNGFIILHNITTSTLLPNWFHFVQDFLQFKRWLILNMSLHIINILPRGWNQAKLHPQSYSTNH